MCRPLREEVAERTEGAPPSGPGSRPDAPVSPCAGGCRCRACPDAPASPPCTAYAARMRVSTDAKRHARFLTLRTVGPKHHSCRCLPWPYISEHICGDCRCHYEGASPVAAAHMEVKSPSLGSGGTTTALPGRTLASSRMAKSSRGSRPTCSANHESSYGARAERPPLPELRRLPPAEAGPAGGPALCEPGGTRSLIFSRGTPCWNVADKGCPLSFGPRADAALRLRLMG